MDWEVLGGGLGARGGTAGRGRREYGEGFGSGWVGVWGKLGELKKLVGATSRVSRAGLGSHLGCCDPLGLVAKRCLGSCCIRARARVAGRCHLAVALTGGHTLQEQVKVKTIYKQLIIKIFVR